MATMERYLVRAATFAWLVLIAGCSVYSQPVPAQTSNVGVTVQTAPQDVGIEVPATGGEPKHRASAETVSEVQDTETAPAAPQRLIGQSFTCTTPIPTLKDQMIRESTARYPGNCPCPYFRDRAGRSCGKRSAWSRPGGYSPLCYPADITPDMVREFCEVLKIRGGGG